MSVLKQGIDHFFFFFLEIANDLDERAYKNDQELNIAEKWLRG